MSNVMYPDVSLLLSVVQANVEGRKALVTYIQETGVVERIAEWAIATWNMEVYDIALQAIHSDYPVETLNTLLVAMGEIEA